MVTEPVAARLLSAGSPQAGGSLAVPVAGRVLGPCGAGAAVAGAEGAASAPEQRAQFT